MAKIISAKMKTLIESEVVTLATCWKVTRTDGIETFITDHDTDILFAGDTYAAASGIARTAIESAADMSVDNLDVVGIFGGIFSRNDMDAGFYDFAEMEIFSVNWQDPDGFGKIQHRFGTIGEMETKDGGYIAEMRGLMQLLHRRRGKLWSPDCRTDVFSPLVNAFSGRADGCGLDPTLFEEFGIVEAVTDDRKMTVGEFSRLKLTPLYGGFFGDVVGVHEVDGKVEMVLDIADGSPMRPTVITTKAELEAVNDDLNGYYVLANDIDVTVANWTPLGSRDDPFRGVFDGRGYRILNLTVSPAPAAEGGLFGECGGVIRNVGIMAGNVRSNSATEWAGALCGVLRSENVGFHPVAGAGRIENCWALGTVVRTDDDKAGGLIGVQLTGAIVKNCWTASRLVGTIGVEVGAFVGRSNGANHILTDCYANTDAANTTDLGQITGGGVTGLTDAEWVLQASFPGFDFVDTKIMNVIASTAADIRFDSRDPFRDRIVRTDASWFIEHVRPGDHITFTGTGQTGGMTPGTSIVIAADDTLTRTVGDWLAEDFKTGSLFTIAGSSNNNGSYIVKTVTTLVITVEEDITVPETAQTDLVIDWTSNNDGTFIIRFVSQAILEFEEQVQPGPEIACNFSIAGGPRILDPGRF